MVKEIDLTNSSTSERILVANFFKSELAQGRKEWKTKEVYSFEGEEFCLSQRVFQRARKEGLEDRFEAFREDGFVNEGGYGAVFDIQDTFKINALGELQSTRQEKPSPKKFERVVKIQIHQEQEQDQEYHPSLFAQNEVKKMRLVPHLHVKPLSLSQKSKDQSRSFIVMRKMPGEELLSLIKKDRERPFLSFQRRKQLNYQLLYGQKKQVNELGLIHRDIKPENILVKLTEQSICVHFIDYALAIFSEELVDDFSGARDYLAPEVSYNPLLTTAKADVYSMGCNLILLWNGSLSNKRHSDLFRGMNDIKLHVKENIRYILEGMLEEDPLKRFSLAEAIDLFAHVEDHDLFNRVYKNDQDLEQRIRLRDLCTRYLSYLELEFSESPLTRHMLLKKDFVQMNEDNSILGLAVKKYKAVVTLVKILIDSREHAKTINKFKETLSSYKPLLETNRDTLALTFLKGTVTFVTLGAAYKAGLWDTEGQKLIKKLEKELVSSPDTNLAVTQNFSL